MSELKIRQSARITIAIHGLSCGGGGSLAAERALKRVHGVVHAYVNPAIEMAYVEYDTELTSEGALIAAVEGAGLRPGELSRR